MADSPNAEEQRLRQRQRLMAVLVVFGTSLGLSSTTSSPKLALLSLTSTSSNIAPWRRRARVSVGRNFGTARQRRPQRKYSAYASVFSLSNSTAEGGNAKSSSGNGSEEIVASSRIKAGTILKNGLKLGGLLGFGYGAYLTTRAIQMFMESGGPPNFDEYDRLYNEGFGASEFTFPFNGTIDQEEAYYFSHWRSDLVEKSRRELIALLEEEGFNPKQTKGQSKDLLINLYLEQMLRKYRHARIFNTNNSSDAPREASSTSESQSTKTPEEQLAQYRSERMRTPEEELAARLGIEKYSPKEMTEQEMWDVAKEVLGKDMVSREEFKKIYADPEEDDMGYMTEMDLGYKYARELFDEYYDVFKELDEKEENRTSVKSN